MKNIFKKSNYKAPQVEFIRFHAPLSLLIGMSAESDLFGDYSDEGELIDANSYDDLHPQQWQLLTIKHEYALYK